MHTPPSRSRSNSPPRPPHRSQQAPGPEAPPDGKHVPRAGHVQMVRWHPSPARGPAPARIPLQQGQALIPRNLPEHVPAHMPALRRAQAAEQMAGQVAAPPPAPVPAQALLPQRLPPDAADRPWHAGLQACLFRATDRITFRGALAPLLSGCMKWAVSGKAGTGNAVDDWIGPAVWASFLQLLAGALLPGEREHGFAWMGTLLPNTDLEPPPSVARWGVHGPAEDQDLLRRLDRERALCVQGAPHLAGRQEEYRGRLDDAEARMRRRLLRDRDWADGASALAMLGAMAADTMTLFAARDDLDADRLDSRTYYGIVPMLLFTFFLDAAAGLWQMRSRRPTPEGYPRAEPPPLRGWAPADAPAPPAARPGDAPGPAAGPRQSGPR